MAIPARYNSGYNIGVGGAVVREGRLLLVRRASRHGRGNWQLPGGFIEPDETIEQAVVREIFEEAGVTAEVEAVLGLRSRYDPESGNGIYIVLVLRPISGEPTADNHDHLN
jgi:ADP-ribose pyrophosphatase YjhB (NUDIX family)